MALVPVFFGFQPEVEEIRFVVGVMRAQSNRKIVLVLASANEGVPRSTIRNAVPLGHFFFCFLNLRLR